MRKNPALSLLTEFSVGVRRLFLSAVIFSALSIFFTFLTPQIIRFTVDSVIGTEPVDLPSAALRIIDALGGLDALRADLLICAGAIALCAALSGIFNCLSRTSLARTTEGFIKKLRDSLFSHIQSLPFSWHTQNQTGDVIQRCTSDVETLRGFVSSQLLEVIRTLLLMTIALVLMFSMNTTLALICLAFMPIIIAYSALFHGRISRQFRDADEAEGDMMVDVQENLTGVRVVRAFGMEREERSRFEKAIDIFTQKWIDLGYTLGFFWGVGDLATCLQMLIVICLGAYLAATGRLTLGQLMAFISYTQTLSGPVRDLGRTLSEFSKSVVAAERLCEILDAPSEPDEPEAQTPPLCEDIRFEHVSFAYGENKVLDDVSFTVPRGTTLGILGATGSGKTTVTYLLNRLYDLPEGSGRITIGGVDIRDIDRRCLRRGVGLVLQEPFLFSKTVAENIAIAIPGAAIDEIRAAASVADVDDNIMSFRDGYDTVVGERGVTLSGGQKQRIAIARTLMLGCPILVFDDSMSAVDMETDARIRDSLRENSGDATVIMISHRINTLMSADNIIVLEDGRITASGTHEQLIHTPGVYQRVYNIQSDAGLYGDGGEFGA